MKTLFEQKTFEDDWFTDMRKPAGMSDREWNDFQLYLRCNLGDYLLRPRWAWALYAVVLVVSVIQVGWEIGWSFPELGDALMDLVPLLALGSLWLTLRWIDWSGKDRLVTTVLGRKHPKGLL